MRRLSRYCPGNKIREASAPNSNQGDDRILLADKSDGKWLEDGFESDASPIYQTNATLGQDNDYWRRNGLFSSFILEPLGDLIMTMTNGDKNYLTGEYYLLQGERNQRTFNTVQNFEMMIMGGFALRGIGLTGKFGQFSDWFRTGQTRIPPQVSGLEGYSKSWAIKGGGINPKTKFSLPFHYHIHKYNWFKPWEWFKYTPMK